MLETSEMTPWQRVEQELAFQKRDWRWVSEQLQATMQSINHWEHRGIPAKHHARLEDILGKPRGWVAEGIVEQRKDYTEMAKDLAELFDLIPKSEVVRRTRAYALAWDAIRREVPDIDANGKA